MKNISPSSLPHFHGLTLEDPDTFLFEFVVICRNYGYTTDEKKLKIFPSTLKDEALGWFMGLPGDRMSLHFIQVVLSCCSGSDLAGQTFEVV